MTAQILDGKRVAAECRRRVRTAVEQRVSRGARPPGLAVVLVGNDAASEIYVKAKRRDCQEVGFHSRVERAPATITQAELEARVAALNATPEIDGILVQLPLPKHIDADRITDCIAPAKDVDGFHPYNVGRLALRRPALPPCTSKGVMLLLDSTGVDCLGARATVIGASNHVGRPMALELPGASAARWRWPTNSPATSPPAPRRRTSSFPRVGRPGLVAGGLDQARRHRHRRGHYPGPPRQIAWGRGL